jgi:predicted Zn finger-like uncharacterized protein
MVNATCQKCGALHRFEDADVPPSGKVMKCSVCGHAMTVMHAAAAEMGFEAPKAAHAPTIAGAGTIKPPGPPVKPPGPPVKPPLPPKPPTPPVKPPAPPAPPAKASKGPALAAFEDDQGGMFELDEGGIELGLADVPAPKRPSPLAGAVGGGRPEPRTSLPAEADFFDLELPPSGPAGGDDLLAPVGPTSTRGGIPDLPAPVGPSSRRAIPDLPAPVGPSPTRGGAPGGAHGGIPDLPAPVGPAPTRGLTDLPAPVGPKPRAPTPAAGIPDLPAPVGATPTRTPELPVPVGATPTRGPDLPVPVGPVPTKSIDLPAPKGFFDDVPAPPTGLGGSDLPAPKGFFDDLPGATSPRPGGASDLPAPKGFFDDIPAPVSAKPGGPADLPAPKGFFDDIPAAKPPAPAPGGMAVSRTPTLDLDDLDLAPPASVLSAPHPLPPIATAPPAASAGPDDAPMLELDGLDLGGGGPQLSTSDRLGGDRFGEVDLPDAPAMPGVVSFTKPAAGAAAPKPAAEPVRKLPERGPAVDKLDIDEGVRKEAVAKVTKGATVTKAKRAAADAEKKKFKLGRMPMMIIGAVLIVGVLGAAGWWFVTKRQASKARSEEAGSLVGSVRVHMSSDKPLHWDRALAEAEKALKVDPASGDALGLTAQAAYAALIDEGTRTAERRAKGGAMIDQINDKGAKGPEVEKAEALHALVEGNAKKAAADLEAFLRKKPTDGDAKLYAGWAWAAAHDPRKALQWFDGALKQHKDRLPALYGRAQALLALGGTADALKAFAATRTRDEQYRNLEGYVEHLGALVGSYQLGEVARFSERESRYLEITTHPQKDKADPRAVAMAWALAGDQALVAGRGDEARRRYDQALVLDGGNLRALIGIARVDQAQGRLGEARTKLEQLLAADPTNLDATLALSETLLGLDQPAEAEKRVRVLLDRQPPLDSKYDLARARLVQGAIYARDPAGTDKALAEYEAAVALVGPEDDIRPTVALAKALAAHGDPAKQAKAIELLRPIEQRASSDPAVAVSLGLAYAAAGKLDEARGAFQSALDRRPNDVEALFQLGLVLHRQKRHDEAIESMKKAFAEGAREDVGVQLAVIYEDLDRDAEAGDTYKKMLAVAQPTINVRVRAGRYYARMKDWTAAGAQGQKILEEQPQNPAGLFLRAEVAAAQGKYADAVTDYTEAVNLQAEPQYLDGLARALERLDPPNTEEALKRYKEAAVDPDYLSPRLGTVCVRLARAEQHRDPGKLLAAIDDAKRLAPTDPWLDFTAGVVYQDSRSHDQAAKAYARALAAKDLPPVGRAYIEYRRGLALAELEKSSDSARALTAATRLWEQQAAAGTQGTDWERCPLRMMMTEARPAKAKDTEPAWVMSAYLQLGYRERDRNSRSAAVAAWEKYLQRVSDPNDPAAEEVRRLLLRLKAH